MSGHPFVPPEPWTMVRDAGNELLSTVVAAGGFTDETLAAAHMLLQRLAASGRLTKEPEHRRILRNQLTYWASEIRFATSELVHPPRLLDAGDGSGLPTMAAADFVADFTSGKHVDAMEVQGASIHGAGGYIHSVDVLNSFLLKCSLKRCKVAGKLGIAGTSFIGGSITNCDVRDFVAPAARFVGTHIKGLQVSQPGADLSAVRMPFCRVEGGQLVAADFGFANLAGGDEIDAKDIPDIENYGVGLDGTGATVFKTVDLRGAKFSGGASLKGTAFEGCNLCGATFVGSSLAGAIFRDCDFQGGEFAGALDAEYADLSESRPSVPDPRQPDSAAPGTPAPSR